MTFQIQEIDKAKLRPGEEEELGREQERLRHATQLWEAARSGYDRLYGAKNAVLPELNEVKKALELITRFDPDWSGRAENLIQASLELEDLAFSLRDYFGSVHPDPGRLEEIDQRLHLLQRLKRKYGATLEEVLAFGDRARQELAGLDTIDDQEAELKEQLAGLGKSAKGKGA